VGGFLSSAASSAFRAIGLVAYWVSYAAFFVLEKIIIGIFAVLRGIGNLFGQPDILRMLRPPSLLSQRPEAAQDAPLTGVWAVVVAGVKWGLIVLGVLILLLFLAWLFNRSRRRAPEEENEVRESLRDEVTTEPLLGNLLHRRGKDGPDLYPIPDGSDPRSRLLRSYFRALNMALQRGLPRAAAETPAEYSPRLAAALPGVPAAELTDAFVRARYGGQPPSDATADRLERTLDGQQQAP
jgi:membrane protein implicated in regulation of membrane protease activity